jgi:NAD(P)-dependent dehydrogenase (short-subunit alcohol dehydrogenase family)
MRALRAYGRIDILLNNVGILAVGGPEEMSEEVWEHQLAVNVKSVFLSCKYILPIFGRLSRCGERMGAWAFLLCRSLDGVERIDPSGALQD